MEDEWVEIEREWMETDSPVFRNWVERRDATTERWGVFAWGGIFDIITTVPFPGR
jgi:hypothetical protein